MNITSNRIVNHTGLQHISTKQTVKPQLQPLTMLTFTASEKSEKAKNIAKRLFKTTEYTDWKEPFFKKWFNPNKAIRVYNDKQYGEVIVELYPIFKQRPEVTKVPIFVDNKKRPKYEQFEYEPTKARMIIKNEDIDITTEAYNHPVMTLALDVVRDDSGYRLL